jgi:hypothetical protein
VPEIWRAKRRSVSLSMSATVSRRTDSRHWITGARQRPQGVGGSYSVAPGRAPLPLRPWLLPRRRLTSWWPPPGGPASKPHCVSVTTVTGRSASKYQDQLPPVSVRVSTKRRSSRLEALSGLAYRSYLLLTPCGDSLGLTAHGSYLFR